MPHPGPDSADVLDWYDRNARVMPWRMPPVQSRAGLRSDPYHVWLSEVMLQQTTVAAVGRYFTAFVSRWPDVHALAAAEDAAVMAEWAGLGYYARARNLLKCARVVSAELHGVFPDTVEGLLSLPGIGPYTAGAIAAIAFDRRATVVDANVERVMARLFAVREPLPDCKTELRALAESLTPDARCGDYAQAVMDLGATLCGQQPQCGACPWRDSCKARALGIAAELPRRRAKPPKPVRHGVIYLARRPDGAVLVETRPEKGLLGGMLGFPGSDWVEGEVQHAPPLGADWQELPEEVRHTFTHFHLRLRVFTATVADAEGRFERVEPASLPTVMRKVYALAGGRGFAYAGG